MTGNSGRKTANVCDSTKKKPSENIATDFTEVAFIILLRKTQCKVLKMFRKGTGKP